MLIRVFRATPKTGCEEELAELFQTVSIPFVDGHPGLVARFTGRGLGRTKDELVMITVWRDLEAMKDMTGDDWERVVIPDDRESACTEVSSADHYESIGAEHQASPAPI